jgi:hypothetical protein
VPPTRRVLRGDDGMHDRTLGACAPSDDGRAQQPAEADRDEGEPR